jgi:hypothetical protein
MAGRQRYGVRSVDGEGCGERFDLLLQRGNLL